MTPDRENERSDPPDGPAPQPEPELEPPAEPGFGDFDHIKMSVSKGLEGRVLTTRVAGRHADAQSIDLEVAGPFLTQLGKLVHGLTAKRAGLDIPRRGRIPAPPTAGPLGMSLAVAGNSVTFAFSLGAGEATRISADAGITSATAEGVGWLAHLLSLTGQGDALISQVHEIEDRLGGEFVALLDLLAEKELTSDWWPAGGTGVRVSPIRAIEARRVLMTEAQPQVGLLEVTGELFRADSRRTSFRLDTYDEPSIQGHWDEPALEEQVRQGWGRRVTALVEKTEHRRAYSVRPYEVKYRLIEILQILD